MFNRCSFTVELGRTLDARGHRIRDLRYPYSKKAMKTVRCNVNVTTLVMFGLSKVRKKSFAFRIREIFFE